MLHAIPIERVIVLQFIGVDTLSIAPIDPSALVCDGVEFIQRIRGIEFVSGDIHRALAPVQHIVIRGDGLGDGFVHGFIPLVVLVD